MVSRHFRRKSKPKNFKKSSSWKNSMVMMRIILKTIKISKNINLININKKIIKIINNSIKIKTLNRNCIIIRSTLSNSKISLINKNLLEKNRNNYSIIKMKVKIINIKRREKIKIKILRKKNIKEFMKRLPMMSIWLQQKFKKDYKIKHCSKYNFFFFMNYFKFSKKLKIFYFLIFY